VTTLAKTSPLSMAKQRLNMIPRVARARILKDHNGKERGAYNPITGRG